MGSRNVLLVALEPVPDEEIRRAIETRAETADVSVLVVAPALGVGLLESLTGAVDEARAKAGELADQVGRADADVRTEVGDRDPHVAVADALCEFAADEIVLAGAADVDTEAQLRGFGLPIAWVDGTAEAGEEGSGTEAIARDVTRGRSSQTPALLLAAVGAVVLAAIVLVSLIAFLVAWLV